MLKNRVIVWTNQWIW